MVKYRQASTQYGAIAGRIRSYCLHDSAMNPVTPGADAESGKQGIR